MKRSRRHPTHSELNSLLDQIESRLPVDVFHLKALIAKNKLNLNDFAHFYGWPLNDLSESRSPKDVEGWDTWRQMVVGRKVDLTNKITAATTGHSHSVSNRHSMVAYWPENEKYPALASYDGHDWHLPSVPSNDLLILENEAIFLMRTEMKAAILEWFPELTGSMDWVFSSGNSISRKANRGFLDQYQNIYVFTDIDLGGLKIFLNLKALMADSSSRLTHVFPADVNVWLRKFGYPIDIKYKNNIKNIIPTLSSNSLNAAHAMVSSGLAMEQEALLKEKI